MEQKLAGLLITFGIAVIVLIILFFIAEWRILTKAGEKGWKSLIPFYNVFISHHIVGMSHVWFILEVITWVIEIAFEILRFPEPIVICFGIAVGIFTFISELVHVIKMCNCFSKRTGFKIGMFFFPSLFMLILAYGKAKYTKPH